MTAPTRLSPTTGGSAAPGAAAHTARATRTPSPVGSPAGEPDVVIAFEDVHFAQGELKVLDGVSFEIRRGEVTVILGPSGTGKSTILWLMLGLWKPDAGTIRLDEEDIARFSETTWKQVRRRLSMVFQENALFDSLTVGENVGYCLLKERVVPDDEIDRRVRETLRIVELAPDQFIDRRPDELSTGQKRRVAIARAIADCQPEVIFYDEPTTGLDPRTARKVADLIMRLRDSQGATSVVVTHEIADALRLGDHFLLLQGGKIVYAGDAAGLLASTHPQVQEFLQPFLLDIEDIAPRIPDSR